MEHVYCENGDCAVVEYRIDPDTQARNCPACGRMGRLKDDPKDKT